MRRRRDGLPGDLLSEPRPGRVRPGIENWSEISEKKGQTLNLNELSEVIAAEMAWMAHWQALDGTRSSVLGLSHH